MYNAAHAGKIFVLCLDSEPEGFDPALYASIGTHQATDNLIYNRLVAFTQGGTDIVPALAEKWDVSADGLNYTFYLRRNVKFHHTPWFKPSRDFNADDVIYSLQRQLDPDHPGARESKHGWPYTHSMALNKFIRKIEKIDTHTVRFTLFYPYTPFLATLAMGFASIVSAEYAARLQQANALQKLNLNPVGTGPFVFVRYQKSDSIRYHAFENYWQGRPKIDQFIISLVTEPSIRTQKIKAGECSFITAPRPADLMALQKIPSLQVLTNDALLISYLAFNTQKKPFADRRIRQALSMAIDRESIVKVVYNHSARPAIYPYPSRVSDYPPSQENPIYDVQKAKALLNQAGFGNGFPTTIWVRMGGGATNPNARLTAELIQADWQKIGVEATIVVVEWAELLRRARAGEHDTIINGWAGDHDDPDNFLTPLLSCATANSGGNYARWCNTAFDALLDQGRQLSEIDERNAIYRQALKIYLDEAPWAALAYPIGVEVIRKNILNYKQNPFMISDFQYIDIK